ncbi:MAG: hypothetical protein AAFS11_07125 [Planctomycetota bacterium]
MRRVVILSRVARQYLGDQAFQALLDTYPEGKSTHFNDQFGGAIPDEDDLPDRLTQILLDAGHTRVSTRREAVHHKSTFFLDERVQLEPSDFDDAEFLIVQSAEHAEPTFVVEDERGTLGITRTSARRVDRDCLSTESGTRVLIPHRVRDSIEARWPDATFADVRLSESLNEYDSKWRLLEWGEHDDRWWQLIAARELPPVSPTTHLYSYQLKKRVDPGTRMPIEVRADDVTGFEWLRYRRSDLESVGPFDLAMTIERHRESDLDRDLVCSQRFRQWALNQGLKFDYMPIGIDED